MAIAEDEFHGVPEATFPTMADLELFQASSHLQMEDGINFLDEMIAYSSLGPNSATAVDKLDDAAPDGHCAAVHAARVDRCITTKYQGAITLAGVRGVAVADIIGRLGAGSQRQPAVSALFLPDAARSSG